MESMPVRVEATYNHLDEKAVLELGTDMRLAYQRIGMLLLNDHICSIEIFHNDHRRITIQVIGREPRSSAEALSNPSVVSE